MERRWLTVAVLSKPGGKPDHYPTPPAGDSVDLTIQGLIPADGVMILAAHVSRAHTLTEWMDASILDEANPDNKDPGLDLYDPANPNQPPYSEEFLSRYRAAQIARNRKITAWVKDKLQYLKDSDRPSDEFGFVVHGTMADPRWLDPSVDPNDRQENWCYLGDPKVVNNGPVGLARFCTLRSWLSQWSYDDSNADGQACAAKISVPILVIGNTADDACTPATLTACITPLPTTTKNCTKWRAPLTTTSANPINSTTPYRAAMRGCRKRLFGLSAVRKDVPGLVARHAKPLTGWD